MDFFRPTHPLNLENSRFFFFFLKPSLIHIRVGKYFTLKFILIHFIYFQKRWIWVILDQRWLKLAKQNKLFPFFLNILQAYCFRLTNNIETEVQKCQNVGPCDANCELKNWEEWSRCSASCRDTRTYNMPTRSRKREKLKDSIGKVGKLQPSMREISTKRTKPRQIWLPFFLKES